jgi:1-acyl-sn-glycerol-3-phosphate acyltransferase
VLSILWPFILLFFNQEVVGKIIGRLSYYLFKYTTFAKLKFINLEKLDTKNRYVYIFNHQSIFDFVFGGKIFQNNSYLIVKDTLKYIPYFGFLYFLSGHFFITRGDSEKAKKTMQNVVEKIKKNNSSVFILPQGTRVANNQVTKLKYGFIKLAKETESDIIPCVISSYKFTDILFHFRNKKIIYAKVCDKISYTKSGEDIMAEVMSVMNNSIRELDAL